MGDTKPQIIVLTGQIASGKTTLAHYLENCGFERVVTYTTRQPREGEVDGKDYHFIGTDIFLSRLDYGFFAEATDYNADFGHVYYGTSKESLKTPGRKVMVLNPSGIMALKAGGYNVFVVYLNFDQETLMRRALARGDKPAEIGRRIADDSIKFGLLYSGNYIDLQITNPNLRPYEIAATIQDRL